MWLVLALTLAACGPGRSDQGDTDSDVPAVLYPAPTVQIRAPEEGATVAGPDVTLDLAVGLFALVGKQRTARAVPPSGVWALGLLTPTAAAHTLDTPPAGYIAVRVDGTLVAETIATMVPLVGLTAGSHRVEAELLAVDSDSFFPGVFDAVTFTVQ